MTSRASRWSQFAGSFRADSYEDRWRRMEAEGQWPHGEADLVMWFNPRSVLDAGCGTGRVAVELHRRGVHVVGVDLDPKMLAVARAKAPQIEWIQADLLDVAVSERSGVDVAGRSDADTADRSGVDAAESGVDASELGVGAAGRSGVDAAGHGVDVAGRSGVDTAGRSGVGAAGSGVDAFELGVDAAGHGVDTAGRSGFDVVVMAGNVMVFVAPGTEAAIIANMARHLRPGGRLISGFQLNYSDLTIDAYDHFARQAGLVAEHLWSTWDRSPYSGGNYAVLVHHR